MNKVYIYVFIDLLILGRKLQWESQQTLWLSCLSSRPMFPGVNSSEILQGCSCEILPINYGLETYVPGALNKERALLCPVIGQTPVGFL